MKSGLLNSHALEFTGSALCSSLNAERAIEIGPYRGSEALRPDKYMSWVEFNLAHAFPVVTSDGIGLHPQVVANSYRSLFGKVFNLGHLIRAYNPEENARDRIVGSIFAVEFPNNGERTHGLWKVQSKRSEAPGIRAVACMHKQAEGVDRLIGQHQSGRKRWTVSRENDWSLEGSGLLVSTAPVSGRVKSSQDEVDRWAANTPEDLLRLGWAYVPCEDAPEDLLSDSGSPAFLAAPTESAVKHDWRGRKIVMLAGGLSGVVQFKGTGLAPYGKENEAEIHQMLASGVGFAEIDEALNEGDSLQEFVSPIKNFTAAIKNVFPGL